MERALPPAGVCLETCPSDAQADGPRHVTPRRRAGRSTVHPVAVTGKRIERKPFEPPAKRPRADSVVKSLNGRRGQVGRDPGRELTWREPGRNRRLARQSRQQYAALS
jgi:hypothetical protein